MFDFAWSEIALIAVVALVAIGPKDLPVAMKAISQLVKKARRMAGEFQTHVDELVREADLGDVRDQFNQLRRMDIKSTILKAVDDDGSLRAGMATPSFDPPPPPVPVHDLDHGPYSAIPLKAHADDLAAVPGAVTTHAEPAPAFIPPAFGPVQPPPVRVAPAFVPPPFAPVA